MIENYAEKKAGKKIKLEKSPNGGVVFSEEKFNEDDGKKYFKVIREATPEHLQMVKQEFERALEKQKETVKGMQADIKTINEMVTDAAAVLAPPPEPAPKAAAPKKKLNNRRKNKYV